MNYSIEEQNKDSNQIISLAIFIGFVSPTIPWFWTQLFFLKKPVATAIKQAINGEIPLSTLLSTLLPHLRHRF